MQFKKRAKDLNRHFSKEAIQVANRHKKICLMSLIFREIQSKTTMRYCPTLVRMAIINKSTNKKFWQTCGDKGTFCIAGGNADWGNCCEQQYGDTSKNLKWICLLTLQSHFWEYIQRNPEHEF